MTRLILLSALTPKLFSRCYMNRRAFLSKGEIIKGCNIDYSIPIEDGELSRLIVEKADEVIKIYENDRISNASIINVFFDTGKQELQNSIANIPFCYTITCSSFTIEDFFGSGKRIIPKIIGFCTRELRRARYVLGGIRAEIQDHDTRTPLLLPLSNFASSTVREQILSLPNEARKLKKVLNEKQYSLSIKDYAKKIAISAKRRLESQRWIFIDGNNRAFEGPVKGGARHGLPHRGTTGHNKLCYLNGRFRLGVSYDPKFHYDCTVKGPIISGEFVNCHGAPQFYRESYLNIAPNDFIAVRSGK